MSNPQTFYTVGGIDLSNIFQPLDISNPTYIWTPQNNSGARTWFGITSSSDGTKLAACVLGGYIYTSADSGVTWTQRSSSKNWRCITSSSDGTKLAAGADNDYIYTSTDSGLTWTARTNLGTAYYYSITASDDFTKLAATTVYGDITFTSYVITSSDSGVTWIQQPNSNIGIIWDQITSSSDCVKLAATQNGGYIYTSNDSGVNWTQQLNSGARFWSDITSSSDGSKLAATVLENDFIYISNDFGVNWIPGDIRSGWQGITSSSDGTKLAAVSGYQTPGYVYTSSDSGMTWTQQTSIGQQFWIEIASSSDGNKLATYYYNGIIYTGVSQATQEPTGYTINGVDLSAIFAPYTSGTQAITTGYKINTGQDLNTIFAKYT